MLNGRVIMNIYGLCSLVTRESKGNEWLVFFSVGRNAGKFWGGSKPCDSCYRSRAGGRVWNYLGYSDVIYNYKLRFNLVILDYVKL